MAQTFIGRKRVRKFFGKIEEVAEMPNLIEVQKASYDQFLLVREPEGGRPNEGLQAVFKSVFPISDFSNTSMLEFVKYEFEAPKYDVDECRQRGMTYAAPLKVTLRLIVFDIDEETGAKSVKDIKEQDVYMGDIPLMTNNGTFIVNGTERVIVSQMHRSPGVFFDHDKGKTHSSGKLLFAARIIPYRGSWLDIEFDAKDIVHARIDRRRKIPVTSLLYALGMNGEEILNTFYKQVPYKRTKDGWRVPFDANRLRGYKAVNDLVDADTGKVVLEAGKKLTVRQARQLAEKGLKALRMTDEELIGHYIAEDLVNPKTGEIYAEAGEEITEKNLKVAQRAGLQGAAAPRHRSRQCRRLHPQHAGDRQEHDARGRAVRHLPRHAPGRAADDRHGADDVQLAVLRFGALRPLRGRPRQDEHAARSRRRGHRAHPAQGGHHRGHPHAGRSARRQGRDRRHRPSRQPPGALGRRADGEPVSHRPAAHGARDQGAHVVGRYRHGDAAGPDQRQAGGGGGARVLRLLAALAVHGPDQSAVGDHPQAASFGARAGRSHARARRLRGARRASDALRPHLSDRDAGRSEYRPDQFARDLCAGEQIRLRRDAVPQGEGRPRHRRGDLSLGDGGGTLHGRAGQRRHRRRGTLHRRSRGRAAMPATCSSFRPTRSTSWTCRRSSSSRSPRR